MIAMGLQESAGEDTRTYTVVVNCEEQYAIWPAGKSVPAGWREAGRVGLRADCVAYVEAVWTDMRPMSLRQADHECGRDRTSQS